MRKKRLITLASVLTLVTALCGISGVSAANAATEQASGGGLTAVTPQLRQFDSGEGANWTVTNQTRIITTETQKADANLLANEIAVITGQSVPEVVVGQAGNAQAGDIVLSIDANVQLPSDSGYTDQGYLMTVDDKVTITGKSADGAFWGTRTLLQSLTNSGSVQRGTVEDWPQTKERSFHIDAARKYYSPAFFEELIPNLAYHKVNVLQYHFSENEGFRLESKNHPEVMSDQYITQEELKEIIALATQYHITVVPALDMPGHLRQVLNAHTDLRLGSSEEGQKGLDYSKEEARQLMKDLVAEFAPLFPSNKWHLGSDEFIDFPTAANNYPQLKTYAEEVTNNSDATVADGFTYFINEMISYLGTLGKTDVRVWNDAFYRGDIEQSVELSRNATVDYWTAWDSNMADVNVFVDKGYNLINFNDAYMYYVLYWPGGAYSTRPQPENVFNNFHAGLFASNKHGTQHEWSAPYPEWLQGASFAIWSDNKDQETERQVLDNSKTLREAFAAQVWNPGDSRAYADFTEDLNAVGKAPVIPDPVEVTAKATLTAEPESGDLEGGSSIDYQAQAQNMSTVQTNTTVSVDAKSTGADLKASDVTVAITDEDGQARVGTNVNVASAKQGAQASASGVEVDQFGYANAIDGSTTTRWSSNYADDAWLQVDFAQPATVNTVRLAWQEAYAPTFTVSVKPEGKDWQVVEANGEIDGATAFPSSQDNKATVFWTEHAVDVDEPIEAVKVQASSRADFDGAKYGVSLWEVEALSPQAPDMGELTVDDGVITWDGSVAPSETVTLTWQGKAPAQTDQKQDLPVSMQVDSTYAIYSGTARAQISHSVAAKSKPAPSQSANPSGEPSGEPSVQPTAQPSGEPSSTSSSAKPSATHSGSNSAQHMPATGMSSVIPIVAVLVLVLGGLALALAKYRHRHQ